MEIQALASESAQAHTRIRALDRTITWNARKIDEMANSMLRMANLLHDAHGQDFSLTENESIILEEHFPESEIIHFNVELD